MTQSKLNVLEARRRKNMVMTLVMVAVALVLIIILGVGLTLDIKSIPPAQLGKEAKPFRVAWVQGQKIIDDSSPDRLSLEDFKGKPLIVNFWASWCVSCRQEARELEAFWQEHKGEVTLVGIAIQDEEDAAREFAKYYGKTYILGLDEDGKAAIDYGVSGVPETFLIDRRGIIRHKEAGPVSARMLEKWLPQIL